MTFQLEFIFLFISYFIKRILSKSFVKSGEFEKIYIRGNGHIGGEGGRGGGVIKVHPFYSLILIIC